MVLIAIILGCIIGIIVGNFAPIISYTYSGYLAIGIIAALPIIIELSRISSRYLCPAEIAEIIIAFFTLEIAKRCEKHETMRK